MHKSCATGQLILCGGTNFFNTIIAVFFLPYKNVYRTQEKAPDSRDIQTSQQE